ncbi:MAG: hypothetical protein ACYC55_02640 [Candidatus Geothermincolia bacterium]
MSRAATSFATPVWSESEGPLIDFAVSTRLSVSRNLRGQRFPHLQTDRERQANWSALKRFLEEGTEAGFTCSLLSRLTRRDRDILAEQHLIQPEAPKPAAGLGIAASHEKDVFITLNHEDHVRIKVLLSGLALEEAWRRVDAMDNRLEEFSPYAFHSEIGYLTASPTELGTGLRASVMMHLPGLTANGQMGQLMGLLLANDVMLHGFYGDTQRMTGSLYQLSNQKTLGHSESDIIGDLGKIVLNIVEREKTARRILLEEHGDSLDDDVRRSLGVLLHCSRISFEESLELLSMVKFGSELGLLDVEVHDFNLALTILGDAHLKRAVRGEPSPDELGKHRAQLIRNFVTPRG